MKYLVYASLFMVSAATNAGVCTVQGQVKSILPSSGVAGVELDAPLTGCACDNDILWIDTETNGGQAMYAAALAAKTTEGVVSATFEDGKGEGAPGNLSITFRYWATCQLKALQVL